MSFDSEQVPWVPPRPLRYTPWPGAKKRRGDRQLERPGSAGQESKVLREGWPWQGSPTTCPGQREESECVLHRRGWATHAHTQCVSMSVRGPVNICDLALGIYRGPLPRCMMLHCSSVPAGVGRPKQPLRLSPQRWLRFLIFKALPGSHSAHELMSHCGGSHRAPGGEN